MGYGHLAYQLRVTLVDSAPEVWREIRGACVYAA